MKKIIGCILLATTSTISLNANAAIVDFGNYFTDTVSGLDWLDLTESVNRSYDDVSSNLGPGGDFDGWRYATGNEFNDLFGRYTQVFATGYDITYTTGTTPSVDGLVQLFGSTLDYEHVTRFGRTWDAYHGVAEGAGRDYLDGLIADADHLGRQYVAQVQDRESFYSTPTDNTFTALDFYEAHNAAILSSYSSLSVGSFLVRNSVNVAEPGSIGFLLSAMLGLIAIRRSKQIKIK